LKLSRRRLRRRPPGALRGQRQLFIRRLLKWFRENGRTYPWRQTADPYRIFVAEFMLQRTGAQQVLPVYAEFVARYPTWKDAGGADEETLQILLRPLGRVQRYRVFRKALLHVAEHGGRLSASLRTLLRIPGVGPYTARAVLVFAHKRRLGLFDPNIYRVIGRVFGLASAKRRPHTDPTMWRAVDDLIPRGRSKEMNLALLDFAAAVCRIRKPLCPVCPLNDICDYYRRVGS